MNVLSLFAVILLVTQAPVPIPRQAPQPHAQEDGGVQPDSHHKQGSTMQPPAAAKQEKTEGNQGHTDGDKSDQNPSVISISKLPPIAMEDHRLSGSDWTLLVFNGLLVLVGAAQALYVAKTLGAIKIQATHMEKQVSLQRAGMKQWVELDDWSNGLDGSVGSYTLMVRFSLLNSTGFYLTISHAELEFETQPSVTAFLVRYGTPLPPNKPIPMTIRLAIDDTKQQAWLRGVLGFGIKGKIVFISALEEEVTQNISGLVTCSYSQGANLESVVKLKIGNQKLA